MGSREKYEVPDWVVDDYNRSVSQKDRLPIRRNYDDFDYNDSRNDYDSSKTINVSSNEDFYEYLRKCDATDIAVARSMVEKSRKKNPRAYAGPTRNEMDTNAVIFILVLCFIFYMLIF